MKAYQQPTIRMVELCQQTMLAASGEGGEATRNGYGSANSQNWDDDDNSGSQVKAHSNYVNWDN